MQTVSVGISLRMFFRWLQETKEGTGVQLGELSSSQRTRPTVFPTLHHSPTSISLHVRHVPSTTPYPPLYMSVFTNKGDRVKTKASCKTLFHQYAIAFRF
jgi:hypothetical protein